MANTTHPPRSPYRLFAYLLPVLIALALRLAANLSLPLFTDESIHIYRTFRVIDGELFAGLEHQKWLYTVALAAFRPYGPESPWLARTFSALCGAVTAAAAVALGRWLARRLLPDHAARLAGLAAGLIYAALPMAVFHERQALVDPMMAALAAISVLLMIRLARRPRIPTAVALALALSAALLTKTSALPYLGLPLVAALLLARRRADRWRGLALGALAGALAWASYEVALRLAVAYGALLQATHRPALENTLLVQLADPALLDAIWRNAVGAAEALAAYVGFGVLALAALAAVWLGQRRARRELLFLLVPAFAFLAPALLFRQVTGCGYVAPRYLLHNTLSLVALAAFSLAMLVERLRQAGGRLAAGGGAAVLLAAILIPALRFDAILIRDPARAPLTAGDRVAYFDSYDGFSTLQIARAIRDAWRAGGGQRLAVLGPEKEIDALRSLLGPRVGVLDELRRPGLDVAQFTLDALAAGEAVYVIPHISGERLPPGFAGVRTERVGSYNRLDLLCVTGLDALLADRLVAQLAGQPEYMAADFDALAAALAADPTPRAVVVFPASHAAPLAARTGLPVVPLSLDGWPPSPQAVRAALLALDPGEADGAPVDVIFANEQASDPDRIVALAVQQTLYATGDEAWAGVFHRRRFVSGPADPPLSPAATFEDAIDLSAALIDRTARPGGALRVALAWQTIVPVADEFKMFAHLVDASGALAAQLDAFPGGGLLPTTAWPPGQPVADRFAISLPPDLPPGEYELRVGLYDPRSGLRLRVTAGSPAGDAVPLGPISVIPPDG